MRPGIIRKINQGYGRCMSAPLCSCNSSEQISVHALQILFVSMAKIRQMQQIVHIKVSTRPQRNTAEHPPFLYSSKSMANSSRAAARSGMPLYASVTITKTALRMNRIRVNSKAAQMSFLCTGSISFLSYINDFIVMISFFKIK